MHAALPFSAGLVCIALRPYGPRGIGRKNASFMEIGCKRMKVDVFARIPRVGACVKLIFNRLYNTRNNQVEDFTGPTSQRIPEGLSQALVPDILARIRILGIVSDN